MQRCFWGVVVFLAMCTVGLADDLTPLGGEKAASPAGDIPAWIGSRSEVEAVVQSLEQETPLFFIPSATVTAYSDYLSDGQKALFDAYPETYRLPVYPSHRTHIAPEWIYLGSQKNIQDARLVDDGNGLVGAWPGVPFPVPTSALEVLWNHLTHWRGISSEVQ